METPPLCLVMEETSYQLIGEVRSEDPRGTVLTNQMVSQHCIMAATVEISH